MLICCNTKRLKTNTSPNRSRSKPKQRVSEICPKFSHDKWIEIMKGPVENQGYSELSYNLRHNFPLQLRSQIWLWLTEKGRNQHIHLYKKLVQHESESAQQIQKDLHRSVKIFCDERIKSNSKRLSGSSDSSGKVEQEKLDDQAMGKLKRILTAYSNLDIEVKYVQGMNFIATSIIQQIDQEEFCFIIFNYILNIQNYRKIFKMDLSILEIIEKRMQFEVPQVHKQIKEHKLTVQYCFDSQIFSLFQLVRKELALRIIDIFLYEKESIITTVIIQLLKIQQNEILRYQDSDDLLLYIRNYMIEDALDKLDDNNDFLSQLLSIHL